MLRVAKLTALLILLPLLLAGAGWWELSRFNPSQADVVPADPAIQAQIAGLDALRSKMLNDATLTIRVHGRLYGSQAAASLIQKQIDTLSGQRDAALLRDQTLMSYLDLCAVIAIYAGLLAALVGTGGMILAVVAGRIAYQSREQLVGIFSISRALLPFLLAGVIFLLVLSLAGLTGVESIDTYAIMKYDHLSSGALKLRVALLMLCGLSIFAGCSAIYKLRRAFSAFRAQPMTVLGRQVAETDAPMLWQYIRRLATRLGAQIPHNIVVGLTDGFYVTAGDILLQPQNQLISGQTLYLPLTYMALLGRDEVTAIIGHELGHFTGADTEYSKRFLPIYAGMGRSLALLEQSSDNSMDLLSVRPAFMLGQFLLDRFDHAVHHWSREREFAADAMGRQAAGKRASACALLRSAAAADCIGTVLSQLGRKSSPAMENLLQELVSRARENGLSDPSGELEKSLPHPTDTHPPTRQRIAALGETLDQTLMQQALRPVDQEGLQLVHEFLLHPVALCRQLTADILRIVQNRREAVQIELTTLAEQVQGDEILMENTLVPVTVFGFLAALFGLIAIAACGFFLLSASHADQALLRTCIIGAAVLAIPSALLFNKFFRRGRKPLLRLTPTGITGTAFAPELPWTAVRDMEFNTINQHCQIVLHLHPSVVAPPLADKNLGRIAYKRGAHYVSINFSRIRGYRYQALADLFVRYWQAGRARAALQENSE